MTDIEAIKQTLSDSTERARQATPEWWPRHPMGGFEIYPDGSTHTPIAHFTYARDCEFACAARTDLPPRDAALLVAAEALEIMTRPGRPHMPISERALARIRAILEGKEGA